MKVGQHIRVKRQALGLKQVELAHEVQVSPQHISQIELGQAAPSLEVVIALCRTLGVSTDYLLTGRETAPVDIRGAIRAQPDISATAKRLLVEIVEELRTKG